ncbi:hypothetical protein GALMADRAFT_237355 [Galerina marginata CBS 339.88]|uniref:F-box domain-containing protein n=1 Tax=Galerina marginata (strain CBS 339.88) TaxID=685588 RepID=A0A067TZJ7_GALM3|nr:hypothetical protein GALMADRAFT_237355 [Galerina marginata CBS 339.88]
MEWDPAGDDTVPIETGIHSLPNELVSLIFEMNANMFANINALKDTHHSALVSQRWRQILLQRSSVWGKLIDLNVLCKDTTVKEEWVNEILRRSEGALLWIRGSVSGRQDQLRAWRFFEPLIKNNWTRIQKLVVDVASIDERSSTWQMIFQPAPNLETFEVRFYHYSPRDGLNFHAPWTVTSEARVLFSRFRRNQLFDNNAPSLREFVPTQVYFPLSAPWLLNLRSVSFSYPVTLHRTFQAIEQMPLLERLELKEIQYSPNQPNLPHLSFPKLTAIVVSDFLFVCAMVLNHITPAPGCSLSFDCSNEFVTASVLEDAKQALSKYLKLFYQSHTAAEIALRCCDKAFSFTSTTTGSGVNPSFVVNLPFGPMSLIFHHLRAFDSLVLAFTFNSASFPVAHTLDLQFDIPTSHCYTSLLTLSDFSAVEALHVQESSLTTIRKFKEQKLGPGSKALPPPQALLFPALKTLRITGVKGPRSFDKARSPPLFLFLKAYRRHKCPIQVLEFYPANRHPRLGYLRPFGRLLDAEMAGMMLKVLSQGDGREVVCGGVNAYRLFLEY